MSIPNKPNAPTSFKNTPGMEPVVERVSREKDPQATQENAHVDTSKLKGTLLNNANMVPSNWDVTYVSDTMLSAKNSITRSTFDGSKKAFNRLLQGLPEEQPK